MFLRDECGAPESYSLEDSIQEVEALIKDVGLGAPLSLLVVLVGTPLILWVWPL